MTPLTAEAQAAASGINLAALAPWARAAWCLGWGGIRLCDALPADPGRPPWRAAADWCWQPPSHRRRHGVRRIGPAEVLAATRGARRWHQPGLFGELEAP